MVKNIGIREDEIIWMSYCCEFIIGGKKVKLSASEVENHRPGLEISYDGKSVLICEDEDNGTLSDILNKLISNLQSIHNAWRVTQCPDVYVVTDLEEEKE